MNHREFVVKAHRNPDLIPEEIKRVERFVDSIKPARKKKSAWLITWEHAGSEEANLADRIIDIRDSRTSTEKIKDFVERYYMATNYSLDEKMHYSSHRKDNPYPAEYIRHPEKVTWPAGITCGHNPYIFARVVKNLRYFAGNENGEAFTWDKTKN